MSLLSVFKAVTFVYTYHSLIRNITGLQYDVIMYSFVVLYGGKKARVCVRLDV